MTRPSDESGSDAAKWWNEKSQEELNKLEFLQKEMMRAMLSESLRAVISQTLLKTKDGSGRVAAHEIMVGTPAIRNLIREAKVAQMYSAIQTGAQLGMQTLDQNLQDLVKRNVISKEEARNKAANKDNFN